MTQGGEEFAEFFAAGWRQSKPDGFIAHFAARLTPDVRLAQPLAPEVRGVEGFEAFFRRLFALMPDYLVTVEDWAARDDAVYLWLTHEATIGGRRRSWQGIDRVRLTAAGDIEERVAYFDPLAQLPALLRAPQLWPGLMRLGR